jgi:hypothetical protein
MVLPEGSLQKGLAMLIRRRLIEIRGETATAAGPGSISPASLPTLLLGEILLLIGP